MIKIKRIHAQPEVFGFVAPQCGQDLALLLISSPQSLQSFVFILDQLVMFSGIPIEFSHYLWNAIIG